MYTNYQSIFVLLFQWDRDEAMRDPMENCSREQFPIMAIYTCIFLLTRKTMLSMALVPVGELVSKEKVGTFI